MRRGGRVMAAVITVGGALACIGDDQPGQAGNGAPQQPNPEQDGGGMRADSGRGDAGGGRMPSTPEQGTFKLLDAAVGDAAVLDAGDAGGQGDAGPGDAAASDAARASDSGAAVCGDGVRQDGELCDFERDDCCNSTCDGVRSQGEVCREAAGACDEAERCPGDGPDCPSDVWASAGTLCNPAIDGCDAPEYCSGGSVDCPPDRVATSGTVCREASGPCDVAETCDGSAASCPNDAVRDDEHVCGPAVDACDLPELCDGASKACGEPVLHCDLIDIGGSLGLAVALGDTSDTGCDLHRVPDDCFGPGGVESVIRFAAPGAGDYVIDTFGSEFDTILMVGDALACGDLGEPCNDDAGGVTQSIVGVTLAESQSIFIAVDGWEGSAGRFALNVHARDRSDCCSVHLEAGCRDAEVTRCVCELDDQCCDTARSGDVWDTVCVSLADLECGGC